MLLQLGIVLAVTLQRSKGVMLIVPVLLLMRNLFEMAASNSKVGLLHLLLLIRSVFQVTFVCF